MRKLAILVLLLISFSSFAQRIQGDLYVNGAKYTTNESEIMVFSRFALKARFPIYIDDASGEDMMAKKVTNFNNEALDFHSIMEVIKFMEENGYTLKDKQIVATGSVLMAYLFFTHTQ